MSVNNDKIKFLVKLPDEEQDVILAYNAILDIIHDQFDDKQNNPDQKWIFKGITAHGGPLSPQHPLYGGSKYNDLVQWEDGTVASEPTLDFIAKDDLVSCAKYAKEHNLLDNPGWKRFLSLANNNFLSD